MPSLTAYIYIIPVYFLGKLYRDLVSLTRGGSKGQMNKKNIFRHSNATVIYPTLQQAMHGLNGAHDPTFKPISDRSSMIMGNFSYASGGDIGVGLFLLLLNLPGNFSNISFE